MTPPEAETLEQVREGMTLLRPGASASGHGISSGFPDDLFEQARGRLRLLALFLAAAFGFDVLIFFGLWVHGLVTGGPPPESFLRSAGFQWVSLGVVLVSAGVAWAAKNPRIAAPRLHTIGLVYEVFACAMVAVLTYWQSFLESGTLPKVTWIPFIVVMFPLIMPGPPRRMLAAAIASGAAAPLSLLALSLAGRIDTGDGSIYVPATVGSAFAVVFALMGARVVYGLGREVARARALGSYQLEERLGVGGMGEVWRARHRLLARPAAVKLIRPALSNDGNVRVSAEAKHRFEREAQVIATLRSPHTVDLFDFGVADDGSFYYAMELLDGVDAETLVRRFGPVPAARVVHVLRQVCHSLSEAESRGLVHRDVKPANIFLCRYGEDLDFVKVLDFGIVKTSREDEGTDTGLTGKHSVHGTPAYMAPEQALGRTDIDARADIYSLGCVGYWLLTGMTVFTAETPTGLLMHHIQTPPVPPSDRCELSIPPQLEAVVMACLAKDPADRPGDARELEARLAAMESAGAWTREQCREWWERHLPAPVPAPA